MTFIDVIFPKQIENLKAKANLYNSFIEKNSLSSFSSCLVSQVNYLHFLFLLESSIAPSFFLIFIFLYRADNSGKKAILYGYTQSQKALK